MRPFHAVRWVSVLFLLVFLVTPTARAASTPSLGLADSFSILAHAYFNNSTFSSLVGDLGYVVAPSVAPSVSGTTHVNDATYGQAVTDQESALSSLNSQACTFTFAPGTIDLATDTTHGPAGVYTAGVYCVNGSMTVNGGDSVTLSGAGTFIFRPTGTLSTSQFSDVTGSNGASACDIFWTPGSSTTLGGDGDFIGTVIEPKGPVVLNITVHDGTTWVGRALNGDVTGGADVTTGIDVLITAPTCSTPPATLYVVKTVYNDYGGTAVSSDFNLHVKQAGVDVAGSPASGVSSPGRSYSLAADTYVVSEDAYTGYTAIYGGDCDTNGNVTLVSGDSKTCTVSNDENPPQQTTPATLHVIKHVVNNDGGTATASSFTLYVKTPGAFGMSNVTGSPAAGVEAPGTSYTLDAGTYTVSEDPFSGYASSFSGDCNGSGSVTLASGDDKTCTITNDDIFVPEITSDSAVLHVIKHVVNDNGGTATASSFTLHVKTPGSFGMGDVSGSPAAGVEAPGRTYALDAGTYTVSEDPFAGYVSSFGGDCDDGGAITLTAGDDKTCTITNDDVTPPATPPATLHVVKIVINDNGGKAVVSEAVVHVTSSLGDVAGSPQAGAGSPGTSYTLPAGVYNVSENFFAGYTVLVGGDCGANGNITLASGDDKTCTITNNDIPGVVVPPPPTTTTTTTTFESCDVCNRLSYDVYIVNPDGSERHTGTPWVRVTDRGNNVVRYSFEDKTLDPNDENFDYNDAVVDVDFTDCKNVRFFFVSSDADWKHKIKIIVSLDGVKQTNTLVTDDSKAVVGTTKTINAATWLKVGPCPATSLFGRILLQVQQHGEAWYVRESGLRYYMKDGPTAYGMMRNFGLGITDKDLADIPSVASVDALKSSQSACPAFPAAKAQKGKILLQVEQHGEAWYVDVDKCRRLYLKDGAAAYTIMRFLGLGITDADLAKIQIGQ